MSLGVLDKKNAIHFKKTVPPNTSGVLTYEVIQDCSLQGVLMRFYLGQELRLGVQLVVEHYQNRLEYIVDNIGDDDWQRGDDDQYTFDVAIPLRVGEKIHLKYINEATAAEETYNVNVFCFLDYANGNQRTDIVSVGGAS